MDLSRRSQKVILILLGKKSGGIFCFVLFFLFKALKELVTYAYNFLKDKSTFISYIIYNYTGLCVCPSNFAH